MQGSDSQFIFDLRDTVWKYEDMGAMTMTFGIIPAVCPWFKGGC